MARKLPYVVECKSTLPFFEEIAAFNCDPPAKFYASECAKTNPSNEYRVVKSKKVLSTFKATFQYSKVG